MTESSSLWTTGGAGDGAATITRADWSNILKVVGACTDEEGVAVDYLNALAGTVTGANTVSINTGGGLVDGKPYWNNAAVSVNIPSAAGGGNTRIDRIVLRADWTLQTVRITRIAGTDAASPTAPTITQTSGATYDIKLCQALVNTSGTVSITDERTYARLTSSISLGSLIVGSSQLAALAVINAKLGLLSVDTAQLAALAVTNAKLGLLSVDTAQLALNSVDDTIAGNRVPQFYRRQGGSATVWGTAGNTDYTPTSVRIQAGVKTVTVNPTAVTFPVAFGDVPLIYLTSASGAIARMTAPSSTTASGFDANMYDAAGADASGTVRWLAIGPEA